MNFYRKLLEHQAKLNDTEDMLLTRILEHKQHLSEISLQSLSKSLFVAPNTIVRLCKKLGYSGYTEFKNVYLYSIQTEPVTLTKMPLDERLERTRKLLNTETVSEIVDQIAHANRILIFATGLSKLVGDELGERLKTVGINAETFLYPHLMRHQAKSLVDEDVCVAISLSGETQSIIDATRIAKLLNAKVVSITGVSKNTLSQISDIQVYCYSNDQFIENIDVADRLSFSYVVNVIYESYLKEYQEQA